MAELKVKEKQVKLRNIEPDEFIKFMIKYQKKPFKISRKKRSRKKRNKEKKNIKMKLRLKIRINLNIFKNRKSRSKATLD